MNNAVPAPTAADKKVQLVRNLATTMRNLQGLRDILNTGQTRDLDKEFGYPDLITSEDYWKKFDRADVAARVVSIYPEECFSEAPLIYETEDAEINTAFERAWDALDDELHITSFLLRADILSGIGRFGVILLGLDDGLNLDQPVAGFKDPVAPKPGDKPQPQKNLAPPIPPKAPAPPPDPAKAKAPQDQPKAVDEPVPIPTRRLLYLRTFDESLVTIKSWEKDAKNPRFGQPITYEISFAMDAADSLGAVNPLSPGNQPASSGIGSNPQQITSNKTTFTVHWTRIIHLADNRLRDEVFGMPRLKKVFNSLLNLHKISGGSAEMFYKGAFPGISLETVPGAELVEIDKDATKEEMLEYYEGLKRYMILENMTANPLAPQAVDPGPHAELQIRLICIALGCPWRIFMGAEVGQLASGQDITSWNERLQKRREEYISPFLIRPLINRLILLDVLPFPKGGSGDEAPPVPGQAPRPTYIIFWNDLNSPSSTEQADVAVKRTDAMAKFVAGGVDQLIDPRHFLELVIGFKREEVDAILKEVGDRLVETDPAAEAQQQAADAQAAHQRDLEKIQAAGAVKQATTPGNGNPFPQRK